ncbi:MAG TPA: hypothetical protein VG324_27705 [Blastocatellia bacterium]|nr:hypothetical protein [Blastocatellia bacterium]
MKRIFVCLLFLTILSTFANAQDVPVAEWSGGYSYSRVKPDFLAEGGNAHGWRADVVLNTKIFGVVTDISKHYGESAGTNLNMTTFLFGPRFARYGKNVTWFVQSLYGFSSINADGDIFGPEIGRFDSSFAFAPAGGGLDVKLSEKIAFRVFQYDLIFTNFGRGGGQMQSRVSTGVVLRLGKR